MKRLRLFLTMWLIYAIKLHSVVNAGFMVFSMPGWFVFYAVRYLWPALAAHDLAIALTACTLFWFFPSARARRWTGTLDPFKAKASARPWFSTNAAAVLDWTDQRLFGRQKTGRWG